MANLFEKLSFSVARPSTTEEKIVSNGVADSVESVNAWSSGQIDESREVDIFFSPRALSGESRPPSDSDSQVCKPVVQQQTDDVDIVPAVTSAAGNGVCQIDITKRLTFESDSRHAANDPPESTTERETSPVEKEPSCEKSVSVENSETIRQCPELPSIVSEKITDTDKTKEKAPVFQVAVPCTALTQPKSADPVSNSIQQQDEPLPLPCDSTNVSEQFFSVTLKKLSASGVKLKFKRQSKCKTMEWSMVMDEPSAKEPKKTKHSAKREKKHLKEGTDETSSGVVSKKSSKSKTKSAKRERNSGSTDAKAAHLPLSKPFIIPRKKSKQGLFQEVTLDSREFLKDILPIITTQYRSKDASTRFTFTRAQLVHNEELTKSFFEWRKEMKDDGRTEKELTESFAFISTDSESEALKMCQEGLSANGSHSAVLGNPTMGVYLSRYSDILKRDGLESGHKGMLLILKILKGKVKAVPLNYSSVLDPMPNYDSHVAKSNTVDMNRLTSLQTPVAYDATRIYLYEFGDLDMVTRPRQICPYAMVHFAYQELVKSTQPIQGVLSSPHETRNPAAQGLPQTHHHSTPPQALPVGTPAQSVTPHGDTHAAAPETVHKTVSAPTSKYNLLRERHFVVWKGVLTAKEEPLCIGKMVSYTSPVLPHTLPSSLNFKNKISFAKMLSYFPSGIFASGIPLTTDIREVCRRNKYVVYCELQQMKESHKRFEHLLQFLIRDQVVLKCILGGGVTVFVLPTSPLSHKLGLTKGDYPDTLHVLFTSHLPMIGHITEKSICMPPGSKIQRPIPDNQLLEKSSNKQLMLRIGLVSMFTRQSHDLKRRQPTEIPTMSPQLEVSESQAASMTLSSSSSAEHNVTVIDYQHGITPKKDLVLTYKKLKLDLVTSRMPASVHSVHPMYSSPSSGLELKSDVNPEASFHPMYNISETSPSIAKESTPKGTSHLMHTPQPQMPHKTSETSTPIPKEGTPKAAPHPMYTSQPEFDLTTSETTPGTPMEKIPKVFPHPMYMSASPYTREAAPQEKVHPMYSHHIEVARGDPGTPLRDEAFSPRSVMRDPRLANGHPHAHYKTPFSTSDYQRATDISGIEQEPPQVSRSSNMELGSILDKQQEIKKLKEEMKILRQLKENTVGDQGLEQLYNTKLTKLQDILAALLHERDRLNQPQAGEKVESQSLSHPHLGGEKRQFESAQSHPQGIEELQGQDLSLEGSRQKSQGYVGEERGRRPPDKTLETEREFERQTVPVTPEMTDDPSIFQTPTLSTRLADCTVIPALSKKVNVSIETLKAVIEKVLSDPSQPTNEKPAVEDVESSKDTPSSFPVSIPLSMLSSEKAFEAKGRVGNRSGSSLDGSKTSITGPEATIKSLHSENENKNRSDSKRPFVAFDEALASMDNYTQASKKQKRSHSRELGATPPAASALPKTPTKSSGTKDVEQEKNLEADGGGALDENFPKDEIQNSEGMESFIERFNKDGPMLDVNSAKRILSNQGGELSSPIHGASEMKAFLNVGVKSSGNRIISATEMKSYLNKKLVEVEREKLNRGKKGGTPGRRGKGANSRERTIAEIDAEIKRLNKEKERLKMHCSRKRHGSGGGHSDKPSCKLPFIPSVDLSGLGRIPKKKTPSPETVEGAPGPTQREEVTQSLPKAMEEEISASTVGVAEDIPEDIAAMVSNSHHESPKPCFLICSREIQLRGGKEKAMFETGLLKDNKRLVVMVLTRKYLQAGMKECDWSGPRLQDCVRDILHVKSRKSERSETEPKSQFSKNAQAAVRIVFARQRMVVEPIGRLVTENNQTVMFNSATGENLVDMLETPSGSIDKDQELIDTDQDLEMPGGEIKNSQDQDLTGKDISTAPKKPGSAEELGHIEDGSQEGQSKNLESASTSLGEGAKGSGPLSADCEQELDKAVERALKDSSLIINDGACFFGDLESEEGVSVEMKLDEEAASAPKKATVAPTTATAGACQGGVGKGVMPVPTPVPTINSTISKPSLNTTDGNSTSSSNNNSTSNNNSSSSNNCSSYFTDRYNNSNSSSQISYRDDSTFNSSSSSSSISNSSSGSNTNSSEMLGAGGGSSASHIMGGGDYQPQHVNTIPAYQFSTQLASNNVPSSAANTSVNRVNTLGSPPVITQQYIPAKLATSKDSCLVSCSINVSRDPRIMRKNSQSDPSKTLQQTESPASTIPAAATTHKQSQSSSTMHASSSTPTIPKEKPTKSILKGSQRHSIDLSTEKENCLSGPSLEQDSASDASKKVKISLLEYKGKGRQTETSGMQEVDPTLDVRQIALSPSCSNIQVTVTGDKKRTLLLEEIDGNKPKEDDEEILTKTKQDVVASDEIRNPPHREEKLLTVQISSESDSRVVVDRSISPLIQQSLPHGDVRLISKTNPIDNAFLRDQPNLVITIPRDDTDDPKDTLLKPIENISKIVKHQSNGEVNSSAHFTDTNAPEVSKKLKMSLENSVTIALLELEDAIFNISADTVADIKTGRSYLGEHLAKLSPTSVSRRLQDIRYELDAFWSELRTLDLPESLQVTEAVPCDPRGLSLNRKPLQNGEVNGDDMTAHTINDIMMDITSKMMCCLESDTMPRKQHEKMTTCFSTHLPKLVKLTGVFSSPRNSPENLYVHLDQMDGMISGIKHDIEQKVEDLYYNVIDHSSPIKKVQKVSEMPEFSSKPDIPLIVQQLLTAARARSCKIQDTSSNLKANFSPVEACDTKAPSTVDYNRNDSLNPERPTKENDTNMSSWKRLDNNSLPTLPKKNTEFKPSKVELRLSPDRSPIKHSASSTKMKRKKVVPPSTPDSCKWGKFTMKLWGKRPKKPGRPEKSKTSNTDSPEPSPDTSATKPSTDATSEDNQDAATKEAEPSDTQTVTEKKLTSDDEKAVEDMCAKLLGEDDKEKEEPVTGTGIPTLLNRSTNHASSANKRSYSSTPTSSKESTHQPQTTWPTVQASSHNTGSNQQQVFNPVVAHQNSNNRTYPYSHQTMTQQQPCVPPAQNTAGFMSHQNQNFQYSNGNQGCMPYQGYPQQPQGNSNMMTQQGQANQGFMQRAPSNVPFGPQQNTNCVQQQYNMGYGYSGNLMQPGMGPGQYNMGYGAQNNGTGMARPCPEGNNGGQQLFNMGGNNMGYGTSGQMASNMGPVTTGMAPGPTNMGPGPTNMGPGSANMGPGSANMGPGSANMGPGPTNMGPGPTNMGPGPINVGPGPINVGPGPINVGPGPTNMGPRPYMAGPWPMRQQPPVPGIDSEGPGSNWAPVF